MGKGGFYGNVFRIIPLIITHLDLKTLSRMETLQLMDQMKVKFQRKNCGAKVIRLVIEGEEVVEVGAEKEGDVRRAIVIAEARLISTQMSSSSMLSVFLIIEILCVSQTEIQKFMRGRERERERERGVISSADF
ncbi:hypothetical protein F2Q68_00033055 [Brassica cretica]|uniref:Uncharacterized protein n=1 Tax=Brassica cretica TaxID=69181 RepID=A0A8S9G5M6_BRACR|nr:hypothetical protein F2Q68_00033055 [Brassica cretica]